MEKSGHILEGAHLETAPSHRVHEALHNIFPSIIKSPSDHFDGRRRTDLTIRTARGKRFRLEGIVPSAEGVRFINSSVPLPDRED